MKDYARAFYNSTAWRTTQATYMASRHYICERCANIARIVHHIKYITPQNIYDPSITLEWSNLEALCIDCHNAEHMGGAVCADGLFFDCDGNITKSPRYQADDVRSV